MLYVCVFKSVHFLRSYAMVAACACCSAPVFLCFVLWVGGGSLLICRASWLPVIKELLLYLASPPSNGHTGYSFFQRQSSINPHPPWPATSRACLKGPMMLLPGRPCSCRPHSSPDAPSAPAPALAHFPQVSCLSFLLWGPPGVTFHHPLYPQIQHILLSSTTSPCTHAGPPFLTALPGSEASQGLGPLQ